MWKSEATVPQMEKQEVQSPEVGASLACLRNTEKVFQR